MGKPLVCKRISWQIGRSNRATALRTVQSHVPRTPLFPALWCEAPPSRRMASSATSRAPDPKGPVYLSKKTNAMRTGTPMVPASNKCTAEPRNNWQDAQARMKIPPLFAAPPPGRVSDQYANDMDRKTATWLANARSCLPPVKLLLIARVVAMSVMDSPKVPLAQPSSKNMNALAWLTFKSSGSLLGSALSPDRERLMSTAPSPRPVATNRTATTSAGKTAQGTATQGLAIAGLRRADTASTTAVSQARIL
mmetsp:Transcript_80855/g.262169  ORF Transcript_80855/g.262169 Transcript_80855/m.262169 type:complete len:251 (+) Transcript_80855:442-1194(+)